MSGMASLRRLIIRRWTSITYSLRRATAIPTGGGSDASRTIAWLVNDSRVEHHRPTSTLDTVHAVPTVAAGGTATFDGGGARGSRSIPASTVSDADSTGI